MWGGVMSSENPVFEYEQHGNVLVVLSTKELSGFRDSDIRDSYNDMYRRLDGEGVRHLLFDFSRLEYFGSTFIGILIRLAKKARLGGGEAALCNLSDNMHEMMKRLMLLENTKTDFFWTPFDSVEEGLAKLLAIGDGDDQTSA